MKRLIALLILMASVNAIGQTTSHDRDSVAQTGPFLVKVKMASHKAANDILADTSRPTRVRQYAQLIVSEPQGGTWLIALSYGCMTNTAINYDSNDADIQFTVNSLFTKYAFAYYREPQP